MPNILDEKLIKKEQESTALLAETKLDFNAAVNGITVYSEVILARGVELFLDDRLNKMAVGIATLDENVVVNVTNEFINSNFTDGLTGWSGFTSATVNAESVSFDFRLYKNTNISKNNTVYMRAEVKLVEGNSNIHLIRTGSTFATFATLVNPEIGEWNKIFGVSVGSDNSATVFQISSFTNIKLEAKKNFIVIGNCNIRCRERTNSHTNR